MKKAWINRIWHEVREGDHGFESAERSIWWPMHLPMLISPRAATLLFKGTTKEVTRVSRWEETCHHMLEFRGLPDCEDGDVEIKVS